MNKKKKITILVCTLFMVFSLGACGKTKENEAVITQQESSIQIGRIDEEMTSEESITFNIDEEDDIELKDTIEIDFNYDYTEDIKEDVASDDEITEYYAQNEEELKIITIRRILRSTVDSKGNAYTDDKKAEVYKVIEAIMAKIDGGDSLAALAKAWSQDSNVETDEGLVDLVKAFSTFDDEINQWVYNQTEIGAKCVFETKEGYEIIIIEGITTLTEKKGIASDEQNVSCETVKTQITNAIKSEKYDEKINAYIVENNLSLTDFDSDVAAAVEKEYLTYNE